MLSATPDDNSGYTELKRVFIRHNGSQCTMPIKLMLATKQQKYTITGATKTYTKF